VRGFAVHEDESIGHRRCKVRFLRDATHIELESTTLAATELLALAEQLVPLPPDPPRLIFSGPETR
jgi:hypothetical protein